MNMGLIVVLCLGTIMPLAIGVDTAQPTEGQCEGCRANNRQTHFLRILIIGPVLILWWKVIVEHSAAPHVPYNVFGLAFAITVLLIATGRAFGMRFQHKIWVRG